MSHRDRSRGAFWGLAIGDALGAAVEFQPPGTFEPVVDYRSGGPHNLEPGEWTDDTSMALALADSIAETGWDLDDQAARYVDWWRHGKYSINGRVFDVGNATCAALCRFVASGDARTSGSRREQLSGNGSIMRLAPVAIREGASGAVPCRGKRSADRRHYRSLLGMRVAPSTASQLIQQLS